MFNISFRINKYNNRNMDVALDWDMEVGLGGKVEEDVGEEELEG